MILLGIVVILASYSGFIGFVVFEGEEIGGYDKFIGIGIVVVGLIFLLSLNLDRHLAHNSTENYRHKQRLKHMVDNNLEGTGPDEPQGKYLPRREENKIGKKIFRYVPPSLGDSIDEISIHGSTSRAKKGKRMEKFGLKDMKSDEFYVSDVDIDIYGEKMFEYIDGNWPRAVKTDGRNKFNETFRITIPNNMLDRDKKRGYMPLAPPWIKKLITDLSSGEYAGRERPVVLKFHRRFNKGDDEDRDIIYKK